MLSVTDLSSNNTVTQQLQAIKENDCVIVKATEGTSYKNPYMTTDLGTALELGKKIGVYHYARADKNTAEAEAFWFLRNVYPYIGKAILVLDWEGKSLKISPSWARKWLDIVYQVTGVRPLIYCSESVIPSIGATVQPGNFGLWVAKYSTKTPIIKPWKVKALWQYTSTPYDKSHFYGTESVWDAYAKRV